MAVAWCWRNVISAYGQSPKGPWTKYFTFIVQLIDTALS